MPQSLVRIACVALAAVAMAVVMSLQGTWAETAFAAEGGLAAGSFELSAQANPKIPSTAQKYKNHYYQIYYYGSGDDKSWAAAQAFCKKRGGHLVTLTSSGEEDFVQNLKSYSGDDIWLGGYCTSNHVWKWVTGEKWRYTNWRSGEPSYSYNDTENKLGIYCGSGWNDFEPDATCMDAFVCEWDYSLSLSDKTLILNKGNKTFVTYSVTGPSGQELSTKAKWTSSNKAVAKVSSKGMVVAMRPGSCTITCKAMGLTAKMKVVVKPQKVKGVKTLSKSSNFVQLSWTKQPGVSKYQVWVYDTDVEEYVVAKTVKGSFNTARVNGLSRNKAHKFKIRGLVRAGKNYYGSFSKVYTARTTR